MPSALGKYSAHQPIDTNNPGPLIKMDVEPLEIISTNETYVIQFRVYGSKTVIKFTNSPPETSEIDWLRQEFTKIINDMKDQVLENDQLGFTLYSYV